MRKNTFCCLLTAAVALTCEWSTALATATYNTDTANKRLTITVTSGSTDTFNNTAALNAMKNNTVTNVIKRGAGTIVMGSNNNLAYTGDFHIEEGAFRLTGCSSGIPYGLGEITKPSGSDYARGIVYVSDGASLELQCTSAISLGDKRLVVAGTGLGGKGALYFNNSASKTGATFGSLITLNGDTLLNNYKHADCYFKYADSTLSKFIGNGYDLTLYNTSKNGYFGFENFVTSPGDSGNIIISNLSRFRVVGYNDFKDDPSRKLIVQGKTAGIVVENWEGNYGWTLEWDTTGIIENYIYGKNPHHFTWQGPVSLKKRMEIQSILDSSKTNVLFSFLGPISGDYGIYDSTVHSGTRTGGIALYCPTNSYKGSVVSAGRGIIETYANGALPVDSAGVVMTNGIFSVCNEAEVFNLPRGEFYGDSVISNGVGSWKRLVKTGTGTLKCESDLGAERVEVRAGNFAPRSLRASTRYAGLVYGARSCNTNTTELTVYNSRVCFTNSVELSPHLAYSEGGDWKMWYPVMTYRGYVWNRSGVNQNWSFASIVDAGSQLYIDDVLVANQNGGTGIVATNTVTMTPGAHRFEWRVYTYKNGKNDWGAPAYRYVKNMVNSSGSISEGTSNWGVKSGLMYDPQGRGSEDYIDYQPMVDPGDGSLFTWDLPALDGGEGTYPIGGAKFTSSAPAYDEVEFAEGTTLVNDGGTTFVRKLIGTPTVTGTGTLIVGKSWQMDVADIFAGRRLQLEGGELKFAEGSSIVLVNPSSVTLTSGTTYTIASAAKPITTLPAKLTRPDQNRWVYGLSDDKLSIWVKCLPVGFSLIYRTVTE